MYESLETYHYTFWIGQEKNLSSENTVPVRINISRNDFYKAFCSYFWDGACMSCFYFSVLYYCIWLILLLTMYLYTVWSITSSDASYLYHIKKHERKIFPLKILYQLESIFPGMIFIRLFVLIFGSLIFGFNPMNWWKRWQNV
jgi:hypothetical protein